jgi:tetratricopeptide (TPR) repeat protein
MVSPASQFFLLKAQRRRRQALLLFLQALSVMLEAGYDLAFAWPRTWKDLQGEHDWSLLEARSGEGVLTLLERLQKTYPDPIHRLWFALLTDLYRSGTSLGPALTAIEQALEEEQEREWQAHNRSLPIKTSVILAFFFLLPALVAVFLPLLTELGRAF